MTTETLSEWITDLESRINQPAEPDLIVELRKQVAIKKELELISADISVHRWRKKQACKSAQRPA